MPGYNMEPYGAFYCNLWGEMGRLFLFLLFFITLLLLSSKDMINQLKTVYKMVIRIFPKCNAHFYMCSYRRIV